jgi:MOSC domain-containing protein YiiM
MSNDDDENPTLMSRLLNARVRPGQLLWIGLRPKRGAAVVPASSATLKAEQGIDGDRYRTTRNGARQVTIIEKECLAAVAAYLGRESVPPELVRRNLLTQGINLLALKERRFRIGPTLLEYSGECAPCSQMEDILGLGGYNAMRGHGGITARILEGGEIKLGDSVERVD